MKQKPCKISFRLSERQKDVLVEEAQRLEITVSELILRMAGAYLEAEAKGETVAAVSYGEWLLVYYDLAGIEKALHDCALQISATRHAISRLTNEGVFANWRVSEVTEAMRTCSDEVIETRKKIAGSLERIEGMGDAWIATDVDGLPVDSPLSEV